MGYEKPAIISEETFALSLFQQNSGPGCTSMEVECEGPGESPV